MYVTGYIGPKGTGWWNVNDIDLQTMLDYSNNAYG